MTVNTHIMDEEEEEVADKDKTKLVNLVSRHVFMIINIMH